MHVASARSPVEKHAAPSPHSRDQKLVQIKHHGGPVDDDDQSAGQLPTAPISRLDEKQHNAVLASIESALA